MKILKNSTYQNLLDGNSVLSSRVAELEKERLKVGLIRDSKGILHSIKDKYAKLF